MRHVSVWLDCEHPGCPNGTSADRAHIANLTAPGGWDCGNHEGGAGRSSQPMSAATSEPATRIPPSVDSTSGGGAGLDPSSRETPFTFDLNNIHTEDDRARVADESGFFPAGERSETSKVQVGVNPRRSDVPPVVVR